MTANTLYLDIFLQTSPLPTAKLIETIDCMLLHSKGWYMSEQDQSPGDYDVEKKFMATSIGPFY